jgi:mRNA interferase MazF
MKRCEIWLAELPHPIGKRPVLLLSRDSAYSVRNAATVAEITTTIRGIPVEVPLNRSDGMAKDCVINLDTIATIPKTMLINKITDLKQVKIEQVNEAIKFALGIK